jgi:hypothetical protein
MPAAKDSRPLSSSEVGKYQKPAQKNLTPVLLFIYYLFIYVYFNM